MSDVSYKRLVLKLSGEALMGDAPFGIDPAMLTRVAAEIVEVHALGVDIGIVIGGGNIFRGEGLARKGMDRVTGDHMGMLSTIINALALQDALEGLDADCRVMSAMPVHDVCEEYIRRRALRHFEKRRLIIFAAGTGNPFFTTDTAASLRAIETEADVLLKATQVDGVYNADPKKDNTAVMYNELDYDQVIDDRLHVMDTTAIVMCRDHGMPLRVFNLNEPGNLKRIVTGEAVGTLVINKAAA